METRLGLLTSLLLYSYQKGNIRVLNCSQHVRNWACNSIFAKDFNYVKML